MREDGSFCVQVNDQQLGLARTACDAVRARAANYVGTVVWERTRLPSYPHGQLPATLDSLLDYARRRSTLPPFVSGVTESAKRVPSAHQGNTLVTLLFPAEACVSAVQMATIKPDTIPRRVSPLICLTTSLLPRDATTAASGSGRPAGTVPNA